MEGAEYVLYRTAHANRDKGKVPRTTAASNGSSGDTEAAQVHEAEADSVGG